MSNENVSLFFSEGGSDKIYQAQLTEVEGGFTVTFQYGRRGKPLRDGTKTESPVPYDKAKKIYDKLVLSKTSKGYALGESGVAFAGTENAGEETDFKPQLLNPIKEEDIEAVLAKFQQVFLQIKYDGERRGVNITRNHIEGANRKGLRTGLQQPIQDALEILKAAGHVGTEIDTEDMGDHLIIFDVLGLKGTNTKEEQFQSRANHLQTLKNEIKDKGLQDVLKVEIPTFADSAAVIKDFVSTARANNEEGVVFRNGNAIYSIGRPNSGGNALKLKFVESATVRILAISKGKRSVALEINDNGEWKSVGKCTIPSSHDVPNPGDLAEVEYLYANKSGALYQPVYKGKRTDLDERAAVISQLKYKKDLSSH